MNTEKTPKVAVVTGASDAVARATARGFGRGDAHGALLACGCDGLERTKEGIEQAVKANPLSLTAFQVGLYGWMTVVRLALFPGEGLPRTASPTGFSCRSA